MSINLNVLATLESYAHPGGALPDTGTVRQTTRLRVEFVTDASAWWELEVTTPGGVSTTRLVNASANGINSVELYVHKTWSYRIVAPACAIPWLLIASVAD